MLYNKIYKYPITKVSYIEEYIKYNILYHTYIFNTSIIQNIIYNIFKIALTIYYILYNELTLQIIVHVTIVWLLLHLMHSVFNNIIYYIHKKYYNYNVNYTI